MADAETEARLLDGEDEGDFDICDEEALLEGGYDEDILTINNTNSFIQEEADGEDVLDLVALEAELEDDPEDGSAMHQTDATFVSSTTQSECRRILEDRERDTDKFKNERQTSGSKSLNIIPDSLDEIPVQSSNYINRNRMANQRGRDGRGGNQGNQMQRGRADNKTVLINPHFKGQVKINNDARLTWDARHRINHNKHYVGNQGGRGPVPCASNNRRQLNPPGNAIRPWINNINVGNNDIPPNIPPHYQPPPPVFQPVFQPPQQGPNWNQYPPNSFNQVPPQMNMPPPHQNVFMQPLPPPTQFNQPPTQFNSQPPIFQNQNMNPQPPVYSSPQFPAPQMNQFNPPNEPAFHHPGFQQNHPPLNFNHQQNNNNQFIPPQVNMPVNQPMNNNRFVNKGPHINNNNNQFRNQQRFAKPKPNFIQNRILPKRKVEGIVDQRKLKKRVMPSTNLHEVQTVETPDTTMLEDKQQEEEDEETKAYRKKIEEQKRLRLQLLAQKEKRRQQAVQQKRRAENTFENVPKNSAPIAPSVNRFQQPQQKQQKPSQQHRQQQQLQFQQKQQRSHQFFQNNQQQNNNRNIIIKTNSDESNIEKRHLASFLSNRKILTKDQSLVDTSVVVISNLAAGTTDVKLRKMCSGIGDIKKLQMSPKERQATIQFNSVASAHAFFKKYQRTMLDLSMIQVTLKPIS